VVDKRCLLYITEQRKIMASSLFYLGEIGFNDYSFALLNVLSNDTVGLAESLVPHVVGVIRSALIVSTRRSPSTSRTRQIDLPILLFTRLLPSLRRTPSLLVRGRWW
jgi:hypothetical protein